MTGLTARSEPERHLNPGEVARHAAGASPPEERARIEAHLAVCERCTDDMVAAWRYVGRRRRRPALLGWGLAAAAAVAGLLLLPSRAPSPSGSSLRGTGADSERVLSVVTPRDRELVSPPVVLTWRSHPDMVTYKLSLTTANGDSVWALATADTSTRLPDTLRLGPGLDYFWYVDGLRANGRSVSSGVHQFRLRP